MKQIILAVCGCLIIVYAVYSNLNFTDAAVRKSELSMALSHSLNQTLEKQKEDGFATDRDMEKYFVKILEKQISSKGTLKVDVITSSCQYGILDVEVREFFDSPDAKERNIHFRKCGIIDQKVS